VFLGEFEHSLDAKGRLVLPRKFRDELEEGGCVLTKGQESCLYVFSMEQWEEEVARLRRLPRTDRRNRKYQRSFFASAIDQVLDRQGRIQLPDKHRVYAGLEKDVTVVGTLDRIEIWSREAWSAEATEADEYYSGIEDVLSEDGGI